jgi:hypothetical protein
VYLLSDAVWLYGERTHRIPISNSSRSVCSMILFDYET